MREFVFAVLMAIGVALAPAVFASDSNSSELAIKCDQYLLNHSEVKRGALFSGILMGHTALATQWARHLPDAINRFPNLRFTKRVNLHLTLVHVGKDWTYQALQKVEHELTPGPFQTEKLTPKLELFGRFQQVVAVELTGASQDWLQRIVDSRVRLQQVGFRKGDTYDTRVRLHLTLAQIPKNGEPDENQKRELAELITWLPKQEGIRQALEQEVVLAAGTRVDLLLATGASDYITIPEWIEEHLWISRSSVSNPPIGAKPWLP